MGSYLAVLAYNHVDSITNIRTLNKVLTMIQQTW